MSLLDDAISFQLLEQSPVDISHVPLDVQNVIRARPFWYQDVQHLTFVAKFWNLVDRSRGPWGCWEWKGRKTKGGYGVLQHPTTSAYMSAHRTAYQMSGRRIPPNHDLDHSCVNPACVNYLRHLHPVTHQQNIDLRDSRRAALGMDKLGKSKPKAGFVVK